MSEVPIPIALLVADDVYQDGATGKWVIAGVFSTIWTNNLPARHEKLVIFWQLTGISGQCDLRLRIEHAETGDPIFEVVGPIKSPSKLDVISVPVPIRKAIFPKQGKYWIQLLSGEEILIQAPLQVNLFKIEEAEARKG
ncbi:MAG: hypothetical protein L0Y44_06385 [Phycisphaerales bacterium]|nr:hypothetical protein [Phycisphaerales bacterium]MCI0630267.1 hypothetical protein [Phycisphaerales bacterium]